MYEINKLQGHRAQRIQSIFYKNFKCSYKILNRCGVHLRLIQYCKSAILQLKKKRLAILKCLLCEAQISLASNKTYLSELKPEQEKRENFLFVCFWFMQLEMWRYDRTQKLIMPKVLSFTFLLLVLFPLVWPHSQEMLSHQVATAQCLYVPWHPSTWKAEKCLFMIFPPKVPRQAWIGPLRSQDFL